MNETKKLLEGMNLKEPFADYTDFDDCVSKNKDKGDPEGYCATIMRKVEGEKAKPNLVNALKYEKYYKEAINELNEAKSVGGYKSPEPGDLPEGKSDQLAKVYASCRADGGDKEKCAKIAWGAVKKEALTPADMKPDKRCDCGGTLHYDGDKHALVCDKCGKEIT